MSIFIIVFASIIFFYVIAILLMGHFWRKEPTYQLPDNVSYTPVSIIIPARNEAANITNCLDSISKQNYPVKLIEVILINDHSEDLTAEIAKEYSKHVELNVRLEELGNNGQGKKNAISYGVGLATNNLIITTDADCYMNSNWLLSLSSYYHETEAKMICGPVAYRKENTWFEKLQSVDFLAMVSFGAAALLVNRPIIGNGANLCFEKSAFLEVGGYTGNYETVSGDDVFLLHKFKTAFPGQIKYLKSSSALVYTEPVQNIKSFFNQKLRWASKARYYKDKQAITISGGLFLVNLLLLFAMVSLATSSNESRMMVLAILVVKAIVDLIFMAPFFAFSGKKKLMLYFFPVQILYPAYITGISIFAPFFNFTWKGRKSNFFR